MTMKTAGGEISKVRRLGVHAEVRLRSAGKISVHTSRKGCMGWLLAVHQRRQFRCLLRQSP